MNNINSVEDANKLTRTKNWNELLKDLNYYVSEVTR